jgi:hypothetical protein
MVDYSQLEMALLKGVVAAERSSLQHETQKTQLFQQVV